MSGVSEKPAASRPNHLPERLILSAVNLWKTPPFLCERLTGGAGCENVLLGDFTTNCVYSSISAGISAAIKWR